MMAGGALSGALLSLVIAALAVVPATPAGAGMRLRHVLTDAARAALLAAAVLLAVTALAAEGSGAGPAGVALGAAAFTACLLVARPREDADVLRALAATVLGAAAATLPVAGLTATLQALMPVAAEGQAGAAAALMAALPLGLAVVMVLVAGGCVAVGGGTARSFALAGAAGVLALRLPASVGPLVAAGLLAVALAAAVVPPRMRGPAAVLGSLAVAVAAGMVLADQGVPG